MRGALMVLAVVLAQAAQAQTPPPLLLHPQGGGAVGWTFETWLSPQQEGGEEDDVPALTPQALRSTAPSTPREARPARGHGVLRFARDFSVAWLDVQVTGLDPGTIVMFHIHCGRPGMLGPILVDLGAAPALQADFADGRLSARIVNADLEAVIDHGHGLLGAFTAGCPIIPANPVDRVRTIAGMAAIAVEGDLYLNLHTDAQTFFGDIRGQFHPPLP